MFYLHKREFDYSIRICAYLAGLGKGEHISVSLLAEKLLLTKAYTTKLIYNLTQSKIVVSKQGKYGGVSLVKNPTKLTLLEILKAVGLNKTVSDCIQQTNFCPLPSPCKIHSFFMKLEDDLIKIITKKKISEFAFTDKDLKSTTNNR